MCHKIFACINCKLFSALIFPFVRYGDNLLHVHSHTGHSNNKIVAMMVGGSAAIAAAFHDMDNCDNHHDDMNNLDNNDDSLQLSNRNQHGGVLFPSARH